MVLLSIKVSALTAFLAKVALVRASVHQKSDCTKLISMKELHQTCLDPDRSFTYNTNFSEIMSCLFTTARLHVCLQHGLRGKSM